MEIPLARLIPVGLLKMPPVIVPDSYAKLVAELAQDTEAKSR